MGAEDPRPNPLLDLRGVKKSFLSGGGIRRRTVVAVSGVSLSICPGETVGLVGESGSGKSTVGRLAVGLLRPDEGAVVFKGRDINAERGALDELRRRVSIVFQDPHSSLDPRMRIRRILEEPLRVQKVRDIAGKAAAALDRVGLPASGLNKFPHEFSGGQRQRIAIARALMLDPVLVICDEPVSALDASVQAQILNLLLDLRKHLGLAYLFISHDLGVVRHVCDRVAVMYRGEIVEEGPAEAVCTRPRHDYTRRLFDAIPGPCAQSGKTATEPAAKLREKHEKAVGSG
ncbi:MAG: ABC transporter ATP-binding protein [Deltaproteobacteria bacterium]|nr:ABC transporter ATP-binding protein [Deltaproteobacteria bacterium]